MRFKFSFFIFLVITFIRSTPVSARDSDFVSRINDQSIKIISDIYIYGPYATTKLEKEIEGQICFRWCYDTLTVEDRFNETKKSGNKAQLLMDFLTNRRILKWSTSIITDSEEHAVMAESILSRGLFLGSMTDQKNLRSETKIKSSITEYFKNFSKIKNEKIREERKKDPFIFVIECDEKSTFIKKSEVIKFVKDWEYFDALSKKTLKVQFDFQVRYLDDFSEKTKIQLLQKNKYSTFIKMTDIKNTNEKDFRSAVRVDAPEGVWNRSDLRNLRLTKDLTVDKASTPYAHEVGHILGLSDLYKDENNESVSFIGFENNIMASSRTNVDQRNIDTIVKNLLQKNKIDLRSIGKNEVIVNQKGIF